MSKSIVKIQFILLLVFAFSCGDDDGENEPSFKDQDVQGKLFGAVWEYADGQANGYPIGDETWLGISLYLTHDDSDCVTEDNAGYRVGMTMPPEVGLYELKTDPEYPGLMVLFSDPDNITGPISIFVEVGEVEILTITETEVTGRIHASKDGNNYINGNFTIPICILDDDQ